MEVKTYFLLWLYCFILVLDYKIPTPLIQESATSLCGVSQTCLLVKSSLLSKVQDLPYKGGRVPGLTTHIESHLDTESYSRSWPSKLELRVALGLLLDGSLLCLGPWSACLQPSPCDLMRDSALAFLVLTGLLSGSMGLPIKYPPVSVGPPYLALVALLSSVFFPPPFS